MKSQNNDNAQLQEAISTDCKNLKTINQKTVKVLASSIYQALRQEGCKHRDIIGVSSQLIGLVTTAIDESNEAQSNSNGVNHF